MMSSPENAPGAWGWGAGAWGWGTIDDSADEQSEPADELIERLSAEFAPLVSAETVTAIVQQCRRDLDTTPPPPPEAVEELARQRLDDTIGGHAITGFANTGWAAGSTGYLIMRFLSDLVPETSETGMGAGFPPKKRKRPTTPRTTRSRHA